VFLLALLNSLCSFSLDDWKVLGKERCFGDCFMDRLP